MVLTTLYRANNAWTDLSSAKPPVLGVGAWELVSPSPGVDFSWVIPILQQFLLFCLTVLDFHLACS